MEALLADVERLKRKVAELEAMLRLPHWTGFTPALVQSSAVTHTVTAARYWRLGDLIVARIHLAVTGAGSAGSAIEITSIPSAIQPAQVGSNIPIGVGVVLDQGANIYPGTLIAYSATVWRIVDTVNLNWIGAGPSFALANTDAVSVRAVYEVA